MKKRDYWVVSDLKTGKLSTADIGPALDKRLNEIFLERQCGSI
jgi:hypothetical protein